MLLNAYTLHDTKAASYSPPFFAAAHGLATRMVMELASDTSTTVGRHPADFTLYCVGRFDTESGQVLPGERQHISDVVALVPRPPAQSSLFERMANGRDNVAGAATDGHGAEVKSDAAGRGRSL